MELDPAGRGRNQCMPCNELTLLQRKKSWRDSAEAASSGKGWPTHPAELANLLQHLQHQLRSCFPSGLYDSQSVL